MTWKYPIVCNSNSNFYVESKCWASQHKHTEYTQNIVLSEVQKSNAADEMESEEKECVKVQLRETYASCVPCPAETSGGLYQHIFALLILLQQHAPESSSPAASPPGSDSVTSGKKLYGGLGNEMLDQAKAQIEANCSMTWKI